MTLQARVADVSEIAEGVKTFALVPAGDAPFPAFEAGSHLDILLGNGLVRSYSLCNLPDGSGRYVIAVRRQDDGAGGSVYIHDRVAEGDTLTIRPPRNNFALRREAGHSVLVAGGIGITPIFAMIQQLERDGHSWSLYFASPSRARTAFLDDLTALEARRPGRVLFHFDEEAAGALIDLQGALAAHPDDDTHFYCCGPTPMLDAFKALTAGLPGDRFHMEHFSASHEVDTSGSFEVEFRRLGKVVTVSDGETILDAALAAGADVAYSCEEGVCGSCETQVLEGVPDHRDEVLSDYERASNQKMMICCSRSKTPRLVLDV